MSSRLLPNFKTYLGLFTQPPAGRELVGSWHSNYSVRRRGLWALKVGPRASPGREGLDTEEEVLRQILGHKRGRLRQLGSFAPDWGMLLF